MEMTPFLATTLLGGVGEADDRMNPKPIRKLLFVAEVYVTITWKSFSTQSQVVLSSIVGYSQQYVVRTLIYRP